MEDLPTQTLVEVAYFLIRREIIEGVVTKEVGEGRRRAVRALDDSLQDAEMDDSGLPAWVTRSGIGPADGSSPFG